MSIDKPDTPNQPGSSGKPSSASGGTGAASAASPGSTDRSARKPDERLLRAKAAEPTPKKRDWKVVVIGVLVFLLLVGSLAAWLQGKASRQPEVEELTGERDQCRSDKSAADARITELEGQIQLLDARRHMARAADELAEQNFGSANEALTRAAEGLRAHGHDGIATQLEAIAITPTDDVSGPRRAILAAGRELDRALGD